MKTKEKIIEILNDELFTYQLVDDSDPILIGGIVEAADRLCEPSHQSAPTVSKVAIEDIIDIHLQPLEITGLEADEINELEMFHDKLVDTIATAIVKLYERGGGG